MRNILFITMDQLRKDMLGFEQTFPLKTPVIDRLARAGTVFDNAYCTNPLCVPARASIMTGKYSCELNILLQRPELERRIAHAAGRIVEKRLLHGVHRQDALPTRAKVLRLRQTGCR